MKNRAVVALFVAFLLTVSALAQQSTAPATTDQSAPAASSNTSSDNASGKAPLQYETRQGFWGRVNPFARKKYVQRQLSPVQNRVNELDELTASNSKMIKDVDSRATEGIRMASAKANEADTHAVEATNRAQQAHQTAQQAQQQIQVVQSAVEKVDQFQPATQVEIRFQPGASALSKKAKSAIDDMAASL